MRVVVDINHPAHVHFFKHCIWKLRDAGHEVRITASPKDLASQLLDIYGLEHINLKSYGRSLPAKLMKLPVMDYRMCRAVKDFSPDLLLGVASVRAAHAAFLLGKKCINFDDSEHARWEVGLYLPFVSAVCTPSCYKRDLGTKHTRYNGYHELAYLHPDYFQPDESVLDEVGVSRDDSVVVVRFVSWGAVHDVGQRGFRPSEKSVLIRELERYARVFVVSEEPLHGQFEKNRLNLSPEKIHHLLYFARLYVGEGATMATEAGILGTPSVYASSLVGTMGNFEELMGKYDLVHAYRSSRDAASDALSLLREPDSKKKWRRKCKAMIDEKVDVTEWVMQFAIGHTCSSGGAGDSKGDVSRARPWSDGR